MRGITDLTPLAGSGGPGKTPNVTQQRPLTARGQVAVAPLLETDPLEVLCTSVTRQFSVTIPAGNWTPRANAVPPVGAVCLVVFDDHGDAFVAQWAGETRVVADAPINVLNPKYGDAPADGGHDNSAQHAAAFAELPVDNTGSATKLGTLYYPAGMWVLDDVSWDNFAGKIVGDRGATWLTPGPSGQIGHFDGIAGGKYGLEIADIWFGDQIQMGNPEVDRPYSAALLSLATWASRMKIHGGGLRLSGTGTGFSFNDAYQLQFEDFEFITGNYGVPAVWAGSGGPYDTIDFQNVYVDGFYGPIFQAISGSLATVSFRQYKQLAGPTGAQSGAGSILDHSLSVDIVANGTNKTATLQSGQGASWAAGNIIMLEGDYALDSAGRVGKSFEVNKVVSVVGDTLTCMWPWQYNHGTNGNTFHVQALRGGIGPCFPSATNLVKFDSCHFEGCAWAVMAIAAKMLTFDQITQASVRFLRICDATSRIDWRQMETLGHSSGADNVLYDIPTWAWSAAGATCRMNWLVDPSQSGSLAINVIENGVESAFTSGSLKRIASNANYTATPRDTVIGMAPSTAAVTLTMPLGANYPPGKLLIVKDELNNAATHNITIARQGTDVFDGGATSVVLSTNGAAAGFYTVGGNWKRVF